MNEETFHKFGSALDILEAVLNECNESDRKCLESAFKELDNFYHDIKAEYGYKDNSDKED